MIRLVLVLVLAVAVVASALGSVYVQHVRRALLAEQRHLERTRDEMQVEWGQLRLEQGLWIKHDRIERLAVEQLEFRVPPASEVVLVTP